MHEQTTICCNHTFTEQDIIPPLMGQEEALSRKHDPNLYGGNVKRFSNAVCPECSTNYILWLKPNDNSYKVLTITKTENVKRPKKTNKKVN